MLVLSRFYLSLETVAEYTPLSHTPVPALMLRMFRSRGLASDTLKTSTRAQLAAAFASGGKVNQTLATV